MCLYTGHIGGTSTRAEARPAAQATAVGHDRSCWNRRESLVRALSGAPDPRDARVSDTGYRWSWPRRSRRSGEFTEQASEVAGQQPKPALRARCLDGEAGLHLDEVTSWRLRSAQPRPCGKRWTITIPSLFSKPAPLWPWPPFAWVTSSRPGWRLTGRAGTGATTGRSSYWHFRP